MKNLLVSILMSLSTLVVPLAVPAVASADCPSDGSSKSQVLKGIGETGGNCSDAGVTNLISAIVNILSIVVGAAAVIMIIISGFKYITSGGDSNRVSSARTSLIYALVGVAIAALAQFLVHFVLDHASGAVTSYHFSPSVLRHSLEVLIG